MKIKNIQDLRAYAISKTFFPATTFDVALQKLTFVQADPIRSPARAQDLILRHRVKSYRINDLESQYPKLDIEEDLLYAYGFIHREIWSLLHPKKTKTLSKLEKKVLDVVEQHGEIHPKELEVYFGSKRVKNAWGGKFKSDQMCLGKSTSIWLS